MSFWRNTQVKHTRKEHRCIFCLRIIRIGEPAEYCAGMFEGEFQHYYFCDRCNRFVELYQIELENGFTSGDFTDHIHYIDLASCPSCGSYNHREAEWVDDNMLSCHYVCDDCGCTWTADFSMKEAENNVLD